MFTFLGKSGQRLFIFILLFIYSFILMMRALILMLRGRERGQSINKSSRDILTEVDRDCHIFYCFFFSFFFFTTTSTGKYLFYILSCKIFEPKNLFTLSSSPRYIVRYTGRYTGEERVPLFLHLILREPHFPVENNCFKN